MAHSTVKYYQLDVAGKIVSSDIAVSGIATTKLTDGALFIQSGGGVAFTASQSMGGFRLTNLADGTNPGDAITLSQLQAVQSGLNIKSAVRVASTANVTISAPGTTIDSVTMSNGDRVLLKNQSTASQNGIWIFNGSAAAMTRATDADSTAEVTGGMFTFVQEGATNADTGWVLTTDGTITVGTTSLAFVQFSSAGTILAGDGLTKVGSTISAVGTTNRITIQSGAGIDIAATYVGQTSLTTLGTVTTGVWNATILTMQYGGTGANITAVNGGVIYSGASAMAVSAAGTTGQLLTSSGAGAPTWTTSTSVNTNSAVVQRDSSGNFAAGTITASLTGAASLNALKAGDTFTGMITLATNSTTVAPIKFVSGSVLTTPVAGAMEFTTDSLFFTITTGTARKTIAFTDSNITGNAANVTGTVAAGNGGTGQTTYTIGDLLQASATGTLSKLAAVATGNVLISGGVGTVSSWGKVGLTTHVSGTLGIGNGGTGVTGTPTNGQLLIGNGSGYTIAALTQGTGITITNSSGGITIALSATYLQTSNFVIRETPSGTVNGVNAAFTLANTPTAGTEHVFVNGILQNVGAGNDYTISGTTITFETAAIPLTNDVVRVSYMK